MKTIFLIIIVLSSLLIADFTRDNLTDIVRDNVTGLEWQDKNSVSKTWEDAVAHCEAFKEGWRLPNIKELTSLVDDTRSRPSIDGLFDNNLLGFYWSSTSHYTKGTTHALAVSFEDGIHNARSKSNPFIVRCVRDGQ